MAKRGADEKRGDGGFLALFVCKDLCPLKSLNLIWDVLSCFQFQFSVHTSNHLRPVAKIKVRPTRAPTEESRASASSDPYPEPEVEDCGTQVIIRQANATLGLHLH